MAVCGDVFLSSITSRSHNFPKPFHVLSSSPLSQRQPLLILCVHTWHFVVPSIIIDRFGHWIKCMTLIDRCKPTCNELPFHLMVYYTLLLLFLQLKMSNFLFNCAHSIQEKKRFIGQFFTRFRFRHFLRSLRWWCVGAMFVHLCDWISCWFVGIVAVVSAVNNDCVANSFWHPT